MASLNSLVEMVAAECTGYSKDVLSAVFNQARNRVIIARNNGSINVWLIDLKTLLALVNYRIQRSLLEYPAEEKHRFGLDDPTPWLTPTDNSS